MSGDVNEDEEIYTDGTSISNITVAGVKDKIAMFASGGKPGVASRPVPAVLQRFQEKAAEAGQQTNFRNFGKSKESSVSNPAVKTFGRPPSETKPSPTGPPSETKPSPTRSPFETKPSPTGPPSTALKPKTPPATQPWRAKKSETNTDQNQNVTSSSPQKRSSINIPGVFQNNSAAPSAGRKISIEEKPCVQNGTLPKPSTSPQSPVSPTPTVNKADDDSKPKIDFRANLRPTASKGLGPPKPIEINPRQRTPSQDDKPVLPPGSGGGNKSTPKSKTSFSLPKRITPFKKIVIRQDDGKKFERLAKSTIITQEMAPIKPLKPKDINVNDVIEEFKKAYDDFKYANEELYDDVGNFIRQEEEEEYDDVGNTIQQRDTKRKSQRPISEIPTMTEEEEFGSGGSASASGSGGSAAVLATTQDELYDDGIQDESDELYEPLPDEELEGEGTVVDKKEQERQEKEAAEKRKKEEKDRKEREKKEKQEQAKREKEEKARMEKEKKDKEKREKEEKEMRKKLKLTGDEQTEAEGVVKEKAKGGKLDLAVQPGEKVDIIRMTNNPKGKWLVRNTYGTYGYVDSDNILIETPTIKQQSQELAGRVQVMNLVDYPHTEGDVGPEEMYEDLDGYQDNMEEIYEECS